MNGVNEGVINYAVYENGKRYLGIAEVTLPDFEKPVFNVSGPGIGGEVDIPVLGYFNAITVGINFRHANEASYELMEERAHTIVIMQLDQNYDNEAGIINTNKRKRILKILPKKSGGGSLKPASPQAVTGEFSVLYYSDIIDGKVMTEIDPANCKCIINGKDYAAEIRTGLGMA